MGLTRSTTFDDTALAGSPSPLTRLKSVAIDYSAVVSFGLNLYRAAAARQRGFGHSEVHPEKLPRLALDPPVVEAMLQQHRETYIARFAERVQRIIELCRKYQIEPVLMTQPALFGNTVDPATGVNLAQAQVSGRGNGESEWRLLELYNDVTRRIAREQQVLLIDLGRELSKDSRLFYDFLHFTNAGAQVAGEMIFRNLDPHLQERDPPKAARAL